jgi:polysaccharide export outer membrane protein
LLQHVGAKSLLALALSLASASCDLLPSDGPNANNVLANSSGILKSDAASTAVTRYVLVSVNARIADLANQFYQPVAGSPPAAFQNGGGAFGGVGVGDMVRVTIWEAGDVGLFAGRDKKSTDITVRVDTDGTIALPYAGRFAVAGRRLSDVEATIVQRLQGQAVQPQATVIVMENVSSSVSVQGEVNKPGPYPIAKSNQHVLDAIAMAGGAKYPAYETVVSVTRGRAKMQAYLQELIDRPETLNVAISAGDAVLLTRKQLKFLAFGAVTQTGEQAFRKETLKLSDGLGQVMGLDPNRSDAKGIYLFRREPLDLARRYGLQPLAEDQGTMPIVYQLDLRDPKSFFAMTTFPMQPNDILYVSPAPLSEASRFFQILSGATSTVAIPRTLLGNYPSGN